MWGINALGHSGTGALQLVLLIIVILVLLTLKGLSLWYASRKEQKWWFVILLVINTLGILELIYLIAVVRTWDGKGTINKADSGSEALTG